MESLNDRFIANFPLSEAVQLTEVYSKSAWVYFMAHNNLHVKIIVSAVTTWCCCRCWWLVVSVVMTVDVMTSLWWLKCFQSFEQSHDSCSHCISLSSQLVSRHQYVYRLQRDNYCDCDCHWENVHWVWRALCWVVACSTSLTRDMTSAIYALTSSVIDILPTGFIIQYSTDARLLLHR